MNYDPLKADHPGQDLEHVPSYWAATAGAQPENDGPLRESIETDIAIIGAGYTGLSCAAHLARQYGAKPVVLEANRPVWGCSGRNGSFAGPALGRVPLQEWEARWGAERSRALWAEALEALGTVRTLIRDGNINCDKQPDGRMKIAHSPKMAEYLKADTAVLRSFNYPAEFLGPEDLGRDHFRGEEAYGAMRTRDGFCMHPMKLGYGILEMARAAGAVVHASSPVLKWEKIGDRHHLSTPEGEVRAKHVVFATNGYSNENLHPRLRGGLLPLISNIVVTSPMTPEQQSACNFITTDSLSDTLKFLNYFRRLPDNRIMLGSRGPMRESAAKQHSEWLLNTIKRKFPALEDLTVDYYWGGWVALTYDAMPHVATVEDDPTVLYGMGYCGSGVTAANHAGRRLAEYLGEQRPVPDIIGEPMPSYPFARFRRLGQLMAFQWYRLHDAMS